MMSLLANSVLRVNLKYFGNVRIVVKLLLGQYKILLKAQIYHSVDLADTNSEVV